MTSGLNVPATVDRMCKLASSAVTKYGEKPLKEKLSAIANHLKNNGTQGCSADWLFCQSVGDQSDNNMINAAITALTPKESVVFGTCELGFILHSQAELYAKAISSNSDNLELYWTGYEAFANLTEKFAYMPTITIPIHLHNHWGMCVVIPEPDSGRVRIYWGDSLGWNAPAGVLQLLRAILSLLYKGATFCIEEKNYMSSVLEFENQRDSHSCGFYVVAACATFTQVPTNGEKLPIYSIYCENLTEQYRKFCFEAFVDYIMLCKADVSHILSSFGEGMKLQRCCKISVLNAGVDMYAHHSMRGHLLRSDDLFSVHDSVLDIDSREPKPTKQGVYSRATAALRPRPMVACKVLDRCNGCDLTIVDIIHMPTMGDVDVTHLAEKKDNEGRMHTTDVELCNAQPAEPVRELLSRRSLGYTSPPVTTETEPAREEALPTVSNFFSYVENLLLAGHLLGHPYVKTYINKEWLIRVRLRCRRYKPPKKIAPDAPPYLKCQARLIAQLRKQDGAWEMRFSSEHNHSLDTVSCTPGDSARSLMRMKESIITHYPDIEQQFASFKGLAPCTSGTNGFIGPDIRNRVNADASKLSARPAQDAAVTITPTAIANEQDELYLSVPTDWPGLDELEPGKNELIGNVVKLQLKDSIDGYLQSANVSMEGSDIVRELKYIMECFGYRMTIRRSAYIYEKDDDSRGRKQLQRVYFVCPYVQDQVLQKTCTFKFVVFTTAEKFFKVTGEELNGVEDLDTFYSAKFPEGWHDHPSSCDTMKRSLPPDIFKEAIAMKHKSLVATEDVVRHLEDKYGFQLNRPALGRQLRWHLRKNHPAQRDSQLLIQNLLEFTNKMPDMYAKTRLVEKHTLHSVCWSFPEWREDFLRYGIVPGVSIDAKALANCYNIPLVTICGRTSNGSLCIYFMGFIPAEDTEGFTWFISQFVECMGVSPRLWACDQDFAIISAIRAVVPDALVILDDWHLNQNQKRNTANYTNARGNPLIAQRMTDELHRLRSSNNETEFLNRRAAFEALYFAESAQPRWFSTLYQFNPELVVKCFNRTICGPRFFFQGSGYSESANSAYRRVVMRREIRMARIPAEMQRYCERTRLERQIKEKGERFKDRRYLLVVKQYGYDEEVWGRIVQDIMPTGLEHFFSKSVENAPRYCLRGHQQIEEEGLGSCIEFSVCSSDSPSDGEVRIHRVLCPFSLPDKPFLEGLCSCSWTVSTGIPCRHAVRVASAFQGDGVLGVSRFPLHAMFHPYWRKDRDGWQEEDIMRHRDRGVTEPADEEDEDEGNEDREEEEESTRKGRIDRLSSRFFCNGRAAWNKVHLCIVSKGVLAMKKMDRMMRLLAREVNRNTETEDIDIVKIVTSVAASLEAEASCGMQPRDVSLEEAAAMGIRNTNQGRVKGRGTKKRKRSWTEGASKKRIRGGTAGAVGSAPATAPVAPVALPDIAQQPHSQTQVLVPTQVWQCWPGQWSYGYGTQ